jgi:hypothetical protein
MWPVDEPAGPKRVHPDMRGERGCTFFGTVLVFGLPGLGLLASSASVALAPETKGPRLGVAVATAFMGSMLLLCWYLLGVRAVRWYRRCSDVYYGRRAVRMRVHPTRNERGGLFLELHALGDPHMREARIRIQAQPPAWDTSELDGTLVDVRLDDDPSGPVVVETDRGIIWPAPLSRRENRVDGKLG